MEAEELEYPNGNGVVCKIGHFDNQTGQFHSISSQSVDYGIDFYAPQTMLAPDGRRILIGWMQNLASVNQHSEKEPWFGQMTIPRELAIKRQIDPASRKRARCLPPQYGFIYKCNNIWRKRRLRVFVDVSQILSFQSHHKVKKIDIICLKCALRRMTNIIRHFVTIRMSLSLSLTEAILVQELQWYISVHARCKTTVDHSSFEL